MPLPRSAARALLVLAPVVALAVGFHLLFTLRFEHGDVWPAGSSFRADPLGTKILYVALGELPGVRTERLLKPFARAKIEPPATILAVLLDADALRYAGRDQGQPILDFLEKGGRVVLACEPDEAVDPSKRRPAWMNFTDDPAPRARKKKTDPARKDAKPGASTSNAAPASATNVVTGAATNAVAASASATNVAPGGVSTNAAAATNAPAAGGKTKDAKRATGKGKGKPKGDADDDEADEHPHTDFSLLKVWGIEALVVTQRQGHAASTETNAAVKGSAAVSPAGTNAVRAAGPARKAAPAAAKAAIAGAVTNGAFGPVEWHSALYFRPGTGTPWRVVYACGDRPVIVERPWGKGTVVLASDSYFLSNEAMLKERHPALLAWMAGGAGRIVFDEFHLGVREEPGVALLARRYGLGGIMAVLALLAGLFVWRNAASFLPPVGVESDEGGVTGGLESRNALLNLLRRHLPAAELPRVCFEQWARSRPRHDPRSERRVARMRETLVAEQQKPPEDRDPVAACRAMHEIWKEKEKP